MLGPELRLQTPCKQPTDVTNKNARFRASVGSRAAERCKHGAERRKERERKEKEQRKEKDKGKEKGKREEGDGKGKRAQSKSVHEVSSSV